MTRPTRRPDHRVRRTLALAGLAGALLSGIGDVLLLGRARSGRDFDGATGLVPARVDADPRWRSMWNGAAFPVRRIRAGALVGDLGIGLLQLLALLGLGREVPAGRARTVATVAATAFAVSGVLTHEGCARVILAYRRASDEARDPGGPVRPSPRSATPLLGAAAAGSLGSLAVFSGSVAVPAWRGRAGSPPWRAAVVPMPYVLAALATFGRLPAPVGGYLRPASISTGLAVYFALAAATAGRGAPS